MGAAAKPVKPTRRGKANMNTFLIVTLVSGIGVVLLSALVIWFGFQGSDFLFLIAVTLPLFLLSRFVKFIVIGDSPFSLHMVHYDFS